MKRKNKQKKTSKKKRASCSSSEHETSESIINFDSDSIPQYVIPSEDNVKQDLGDNAVPCLDFLIPDVELCVEDDEEVVIKRRRRRPNFKPTNRMSEEYSPSVLKQRKSAEKFRLRFLKEAKKEKQRKRIAGKGNEKCSTSVQSSQNFSMVKCEYLEHDDNYETNNILESTDSMQTVGNFDSITMKCEPEETKTELENSWNDTASTDQVLSENITIKCEPPDDQTEFQDYDQVLSIKSEPMLDIVDDNSKKFESVLDNCLEEDNPRLTNPPKASPSNSVSSHSGFNSSEHSNSELPWDALMQANNNTDSNEEVPEGLNTELYLGESSDDNDETSNDKKLENCSDDSNGVYYTCPFCFMVYVGEINFRKHIFCNNTASISRYTRFSSETGSVNINSISTEHKCLTCNTMFSSHAILREHMKTHSSNKKDVNICSVCRLRFVNTCLLTRHQNKFKHDNDCFQCSTCSDIYSNIPSFEEHAINSHNGKTEFCCHQCNCKFSSMTDLIDHNKSIQEKNLKYSRPVCLDAKFCSTGVDSDTPLIEFAFKSVCYKMRRVIFSCLLCYCKFSKVEYVEQHFVREHRDMLQRNLTSHNFNSVKKEMDESDLNCIEFDETALSVSLTVPDEIIVFDTAENYSKDLECKEITEKTQFIESNSAKESASSDENVTKLSLITFQPKKEAKAMNVPTKKLIGVRKIMPIVLKGTVAEKTPVQNIKTEVTNTIPPNATDMITSDGLFQRICESRSALDRCPASSLSLPNEYLRKCDLCLALFNNCKNFDRHFEKCKLSKSCNKMTSNKMISFFVNNYKSIQNAINIRFPHKIQSIFLCHVCNFSSDYRNDLINHVVACHQSIVYYKCLVCSELFDNHQDFRTHIKGHSSIRIYCGYCNTDKLTRKYFDPIHLEQHGVCICSVCGKIPYYLNNHKCHYKYYRCVHQCPVCKKYFLSKFNLELHIFNVHEFYEKNDDNIFNTGHKMSELEANLDQSHDNGQACMRLLKLDTLVVDELIMVDSEDAKK